MATKANEDTNLVNKQFDFILLIVVIILLALGLIMVLSASSPSALSETGDDSYVYFRRQGIFAIIGIIAMLFISKIDYRRYKKISRIAYIGSIILMLMVRIPKIGVEAGGAYRWIKIGIQFQPSEIAKIALIIYFAAYLSNHLKEIGEFKKGFIKPFLILVPVILILVLVQDHLSATIIIIMVISIMMLTAGTKLRYFLTLGSIGAVGGAGALYLMAKFTEKGGFRIQRIISFMDPWADKQGDGWQIIQSLYAIGSGGLFGVGLGESRQKYLYISEPQNDFIFSVLAEELGFVGCVLVIALFAIFIWRGVLIAMKAPDTFGSLIAIGITSLIGLQAIINIAVVTSSMPVTGMPLPFFSYGGTSLLILLASVRNITEYIKIGIESITKNGGKYESINCSSRNRWAY